MKKKLGLYVHIPFCLKKCNYCDFLSFDGKDAAVQQAYVTMLLNEIRDYNEKDSEEFHGYEVDSVFIGGGTPSLLHAACIEDILNAIYKNFSVSTNAEVTIESNPKTLTKEKLSRYRKAGINRLSIGCQSTDDQELLFMGRAHSRQDFFETMTQARSCDFDNINVDLMFGVKGQTLNGWERTLDDVMKLHPQHLSFYSLQVEEGTPFYQLQRFGDGCQCSDEDNRAMYDSALACLEKHGFIHYEISNGARNGLLCKHNLKYWNMEDYLGLGLGAHSYINGVRFHNTEALSEYLNGKYGPQEIHVNSREDEISDYIFTGLRKIEGIQTAEFLRMFGDPIEGLFGQKIDHFVELGLLSFDEARLCFTKEGLSYTNTVLREFV